MSGITRLYIKKYGLPPPNSRVFIRVGQQVDGWECRGRMRLLNDLVPAKGTMAEGRQGSRAGGEKGTKQEVNTS